MKLNNPTILAILDGWGIGPKDETNAIWLAKTPVFDTLTKKYPFTELAAYGKAVGLDSHQVSGSETGHMNIGAGTIVYQDLPRINMAIADGSFFQNEAFLSAVSHVRGHQSNLHILGLVGSGGVHSNMEHLYALLWFCKNSAFDRVYLHLITDGRDSPPKSAVTYIKQLGEQMTQTGVGKIASVMGRYYAMDRDHRWERTQAAYEVMLGKGALIEDPIDALKSAYAKEIYDERFDPVFLGEDGQAVAGVKEGDAIIFFNFRPDRMRELTKAFVMPTFDSFARTQIENLFVVTMAEYESGLPVEVVYPPEKIENCLAKVLSDAGLKQLHIAETEKYAHVTFFLNGTYEQPFPGEDRAIIPSPQVASYDQAPAMSAVELTDRVTKEIQGGAYDFVAMNYANPDMVAHTGALEATVRAMETVDVCIGRVVDATLAAGGVVFLTADHGNAEELKNLRTGDIDKEHATNPVPFVIIGKEFAGKPSAAGEVPDGDLSLMQPVGMLADVAPTILAVLGIPQPPQMTGASLL